MKKILFVSILCLSTTPLFGMFSNIWKAAAKGDLEGVQKLVEKKKEEDKKKFINEENRVDEGKTPLHYAAENGRLDVIKYLLGEGANVNHKVVVSPYGSNISGAPLHAAAVQGFLDIVKVLVEQGGANIELGNQNDNKPLYLAAKHGHLNIVKYLVRKGANVNSKNSLGNFPFHPAARRGYFDIVKYLVENGAEPTTTIILSKVFDGFSVNLRTPILNDMESRNADLVKIKEGLPKKLPQEPKKQRALAEKIKEIKPETGNFNTIWKIIKKRHKKEGLGWILKDIEKAKDKLQKAKDYLSWITTFDALKNDEKIKFIAGTVQKDMLKDVKEGVKNMISFVFARSILDFSKDSKKSPLDKSLFHDLFKEAKENKNLKQLIGQTFGLEQNYLEKDFYEVAKKILEFKKDDIAVAPKLLRTGLREIHEI